MRQASSPKAGGKTRVRGEPPISSVDKALRALLAIASAGPTGRSLADLAAQLSTRKSGLHATLAALRYRDFVSQSPDTGYYRLGPEVDTLTRSFVNSVDVRAVLRPAIVQLCEEINEVCHVGMLVGTELVYLDKVESRKPIQAGTYVGLRIPALTTAMGRALIAVEYQSYDAFALRFKDALVRRTERAPRNPEECWKHIVLAKQRGFALDLQENVDGLNAVSIAILNAGRAEAAVSIVTLAREDGRAGPQRYLPQLRTALERVLRPPFGLPEPMRVVEQPRADKAGSLSRNARSGSPVAVRKSP